MFPFRKRFLGDKTRTFRDDHRSRTCTNRSCHLVAAFATYELEDDEAVEDNTEEPPAQRTFTGSPYRPLNLSGFGGRPSPGGSSANRWQVTFKVANKRGLVKVKMINAAGNDFSAPLNKVMREMEDENGSSQRINSASV